MAGNLVESFRNPGSEYRGAPFWSWNGDLEPEELRRQIRLMHRMGLGGFFMHSRVGLATPYLSERWFECVKACIDEADKLDMQAWLYDEDRWPSGAAGGLVTKNPAYRLRYLCMDILEKPSDLTWTDDIIAASAAQIEGDRLVAHRALELGAAVDVPAGWIVLRFRVEIQACDDWYNGFTYLDTLNPDAVAEFLKVTHEAYLREVGDRFGNRVPGIFTDEPNHGHRLPAPDRPITPWTGRLPQVFRERYGYDLLPHLPLVFLNPVDDNDLRARLHYHDCVTHLFVDAFGRRIGEWCEKNNLQYTGHLLAEETLSSQTRVVGDTLRFYEYMQAPGMDILTEYNREYDTAKQVSSVARQFGRRWRLTETYGCTGWDFSFAGHKAIGDWQAALGINLRCQHLSYYTMKAEAKRDYPASIFYQSPWWEAYTKVEDYFARVNLFLDRGAEVRDLLVLHPVESSWLLCEKDWSRNPEREGLEADLRRTRDALLAAHLDFDYGCEEILARHSEVGSDAEGPYLRVAQAVYRAVVVPRMLTMRRSTLDLLRKFHQAGGRIVFAGEPAPRMDAIVDGAVSGFAGACVCTSSAGADLIAAVEPVRRLSIRSGKGEAGSVLYLLREDDEAFYLFLCNTGHDLLELDGSLREPGVRDRTLSLPDVEIRGFAGCEGRPELFDAETGETYAADARSAKQGWTIRTSLPALASRCLRLPKKKTERRLPALPKAQDKSAKPFGPKVWEIALTDPNVLVLDKPRYRLGQDDWRSEPDILKTDAAVRKALSIPLRGGRMKQPWARTADDFKGSAAELELEYRFEVKDLPARELRLGIEEPRLYRIELNGATLCADDDRGWWTDPSLRTIPLPPSLLRKGENALRLSTTYDPRHPGLEIVYLLGDFGVQLRRQKPVMTSAPTELSTGDWGPQGLPFYGGSVIYRTKAKASLARGERGFVQVPSYAGVCVRITANGENAGMAAWEPNEVEVTRWLKDGQIDLQVEVFGSRRNSHGPLHLSNPHPHWTGPWQFIESGELWSDDYRLKPCGLLARPRLVVR